jgi:hypothetical protein
MLLRHLPGAFRAAIGDRDKMDAGEPGEDAGVVLPEAPDADDRGAERRGPPWRRPRGGQRITPRSLRAMKSARRATSSNSPSSARTFASASSCARCARNSSR